MTPVRSAYHLPSNSVDRGADARSLLGDRDMPYRASKLGLQTGRRVCVTSHAWAPCPPSSCPSITTPRLPPSGASIGGRHYRSLPSCHSRSSPITNVGDRLKRESRERAPVWTLILCKQVGVSSFPLPHPHSLFGNAPLPCLRATPRQAKGRNLVPKGEGE